MTRNGLINLMISAGCTTTLLMIPALLIVLTSLMTSSKTRTVENISLLWGFATFLSPAMYFFFSALTLEPINERLTISVCLLSLLFLIARARSIGVAKSKSFFKFGAFTSTDLVAILFAAAAFIFHLVNFDTTSGLDYSCLYRPCAIAAGVTGQAEFDGFNWNLFYDGHQRMGATAILSPALAWNGIFGLRWAWAMVMSTIPLSLYCCGLRLDLSACSSTLAALLGFILPCLLGPPDQNRLVLALFLFLILIIALSQSRRFVTGLYVGLCLAVEPASIIMLPGAFLSFGHRGLFSNREFKRITTFALGFALGSSIFILRYLVAFKRVVFHEHFSYVPEIVYRLFGFSFKIRAFLNWPLRDSIVRSPFNPTTNAVLELILLTRHFGIALLALSIFGVYRVFRKRKMPLLVLLVFSFLPMISFLAINENWTQKDKWNIIVCSYAPLLLLVGSGVDELVENRLKRLPIFAFALVLLYIVVDYGERSISNISFSEDKEYREIWSNLVENLPEDDPKLVSHEKSLLGNLSLFPRSFSFTGFFSLYRNASPSSRGLWASLQNRSLVQRAYTLAEIPVIATLGPNSIEVLPAEADILRLRSKYQSFSAEKVIMVSSIGYGPVVVEVPESNVSEVCHGSALTLIPFGDPILVKNRESQPTVSYFLGVDFYGEFPILVVNRAESRVKTGFTYDTVYRGVECLRLKLPGNTVLVVMNILSGDPLRVYWSVSEEYHSDRALIASHYPLLAADIDYSIYIRSK